MQSPQHKRFSRTSTAVLVIVTIIVVIWLIVAISGDVTRQSNQPGIPSQTASTTAPAGVSAASIPAKLTTKTIRTPKGSLLVQTADTDASRERGLGGVTSIGKDSGMLFVFPEAGVYGFWMKDMLIPLDLVWIGADQKVFGVVPGVSPDTFPEVFYPPTDVLYVLELPAGSAAAHGIATSTVLAF